jgi:hypothetical protein
MKKSFKILSAASLLCLGAECLAQQATCPSAPVKKLAVVFVNGVLTSPNEAAANRDELRLALRAEPSLKGISMVFPRAYNQTSLLGDRNDAVQSAAQFVLQYGQQATAWLLGAVGAPKAIDDFFISQIAGAAQDVTPELEGHVEGYHQELTNGNAVLVVSHSQGNFYANQAFTRLMQKYPATPKDSFGIYGVATPANNVGGQPGPYTTNNYDFISGVPGALSPNLTLTPADHQISTTLAGLEAEIRAGGIVSRTPVIALTPLSAIATHNFRESYLSPAYNARAAVLAGIVAKINTMRDPLQPPCPAAASAPTTPTAATSSAQPVATNPQPTSRPSAPTSPPAASSPSPVTNQRCELAFVNGGGNGRDPCGRL